MKAAAERYLPFFLIGAGGLRILGDCFPNRLGVLRFLGGAHCGWIFWILAGAGLLWLLLRNIPEFTGSVSVPAETESRLVRFLRNWGIEAVILLVTAASLAMLVRSGWFWDDAVNSTAYLAEKKDSIPLLRHVLDFMGEYLKLGRINVLSVYYYFFFYIDNVSVYKTLIILLILADQLIFRKFLQEFGVPLPEARLGMLLLPLMLQTRAYQDPVSGFYGLMQILTAEMLLCALFLSRWLRTGRIRELLFSLLFFTVGLMTYEVCFPFLAMICLLIWIRKGNFLKAVRSSLPFAGIVVLLVAAVFLIRSSDVKQIEYPGVAVSLDPGRILWAAERQITAGLPLNYYSAGYQASVMEKAYPAADFMNYDFLSFIRSVRLSDIMILFAAMVCMFLIRRERDIFGQNSITPEPDDAHLRARKELVLLGLSFALLPTVTIALSERYQWQLMPGLGYLPVYMQYYGIVMLLLWLIRIGKSSAGTRALCLSAYAVILLLNLQNNRAVTEVMNRSFYYARNAGEAALRGGILDFVPEGSLLLADNDRTYIWESDWLNRGLYREFYGNNTRRLRAAVGDNEILRGSLDAALSDGAVPDGDGFVPVRPENVWLISYNGSADRGFARLGRLISADVDPGTMALRNAVTDHALYFISGSFPEQAGVQYTGADGIFRQTGLNSRDRVRQTGYGILYRLPENEALRFGSLTLDPSIP